MNIIAGLSSRLALFVRRSFSLIGETFAQTASQMLHRRARRTLFHVINVIAAAFIACNYMHRVMYVIVPLRIYQLFVILTMIFQNEKASVIPVIFNHEVYVPAPTHGIKYGASYFRDNMLFRAISNC